MVTYELWLDESGDFVKDLKGKEEPSMVGGLLVPKGKLDGKDAEKLLAAHLPEDFKKKSKWVHSTDIHGKKYGQFATSLLKDLHENGYQFVVFENQESVKIVNSDLTYLHILAEGIIQLFQTLSMENGSISIDIIAARRVSTAKMDEKKDEPMGVYNILGPKEYRERLEERLDLGFARRNIRPDRNQFNWTFELRSARDDYRLMIADVICHSWFRRAGNKFTETQQQNLREMFDSKYYFTAIARSTISSIKKHLAEGNIGEALYEWLLVDEEWKNYSNFTDEKIFDSDETASYYLENIIKGLKLLPDFAKETHLTLVLNHIKTLILLKREFKTSKKLLLKIKNHVIPMMDQEKISNKVFFFNVHLMLFTNATHQGDVALSEEQMLECRKLLKDLIKYWENFGLILNYYIRESVHLLNTYNYTEVIKTMTNLESLLENTIELFPIAMQDDLGMEIQTMNSDILGKVYGTRLQAHVFLSRGEEKYTELARKDSKNALLQFVDESDLTRQYQYRSQLECEAGQFQNSLEWLAKSVNADNYGGNVKLVLESILNSNGSMRLFGVMHYSRLICEAAFQGEIELADRLYESWNHQGIEKNLYESNSKQHPAQIIFWKIGTYMMLKGETKGAIRRYDTALAICAENNHSLTLASIGLAIVAEKTYYLSQAGSKFTKEYKKSISELKKDYRKFMKAVLPESMNRLFEKWETVINKEDMDELLALSREIAY